MDFNFLKKEENYKEWGKQVYKNAYVHKNVKGKMFVETEILQSNAERMTLIWKSDKPNQIKHNKFTHPYQVIYRSIL